MGDGRLRSQRYRLSGSTCRARSRSLRRSTSTATARWQGMANRSSCSRTCSSANRRARCNRAREEPESGPAGSFHMIATQPNAIGRRMCCGAKVSVTPITMMPDGMAAARVAGGMRKQAEYAECPMCSRRSCPSPPARFVFSATMPCAWPDPDPDPEPSVAAHACFTATRACCLSREPAVYYHPNSLGLRATAT